MPSNRDDAERPARPAVIVAPELLGRRDVAFEHTEPALLTHVPEAIDPNRGPGRLPGVVFGPPAMHSAIASDEQEAAFRSRDGHLVILPRATARVTDLVKHVVDARDLFPEQLDALAAFLDGQRHFPLFVQRRLEREQRLAQE